MDSGNESSSNACESWNLSLHTHAKKRPFKVYDPSCSERRGVAVANYEDLLTTIKQKFQVSSAFRVLLEEDDTVIDDDDYFQTLPDNTRIKFIPHKKRPRIEEEEEEEGSDSDIPEPKRARIEIIVPVNHVRETETDAPALSFTFSPSKSLNVHKNYMFWSPKQLNNDEITVFENQVNNCEIEVTNFDEQQIDGGAKEMHVEQMDVFQEVQPTADGVVSSEKDKNPETDGVVSELVVEPIEAIIESPEVGVGAEPNEIGLGSDKVGVGSGEFGMGPEEVGVGSNEIELGPKLVGVGSEVIGMEPEVVGVESDNIGVVSEVGVGLEKVGVGSGNIEVMSDKIGVGLEEVGIESDNTGMVSDEIGLGLEKVGVESDNTGVVSDEIGVGLEKVGVESDNTGVVSDEIGVGLEKVGVESDNAGVVSDEIGVGLEENDNVEIQSSSMPTEVDAIKVKAEPTNISETTTENDSDMDEVIIVDCPVVVKKVVEVIDIADEEVAGKRDDRSAMAVAGGGVKNVGQQRQQQPIEAQQKHQMSFSKPLDRLQQWIANHPSEKLFGLQHIRKADKTSFYNCATCPSGDLCASAMFAHLFGDTHRSRSKCGRTTTTILGNPRSVMIRPIQRTDLNAWIAANKHIRVVVCEHIRPVASFICWRCGTQSTSANTIVNHMKSSAHIQKCKYFK